MATIELTQGNFEQTIISHDIVIIDFWADWCAPCKSFAPIYEEVSNQYPDIVFAKVNTEQEQALANHFNIRSIPTLVIYREQIPIFLQPGMMPEEGLKGIIEQTQNLDMNMVREEMAKQQANPA